MQSSKTKKSIDYLKNMQTKQDTWAQNSLCAFICFDKCSETYKAYLRVSNLAVFCSQIKMGHKGNF